MLLFTLTLLTPMLTQAQVATNYNFSSTSGTYTPITGGTVLGLATNDDTSFGSGAAFPIGFPFSYSGTAMTHFAVQSNGYIALGTSVATSISSSYTAISDGFGTDNIICAFNADLQGQATTGELSYLLTGTTPNRTLVVQWKNYSFWSSSPANGNFDFQIRLNETSNTINIVYGTFTSIPTRSSFQSVPSVGLRGVGNTDYNNRTTTTNWSATTAGVANTDVCAVSPTIFPANGLTYTWSLASCIGIGGLTALPIGTTTATLNWSTNPSAVNGYNVQYRAVGAPTFIALPTINSSATVNANIIGLLPATAYEFQVQAKCAGVGVTSSFSPSRLFTTACVAFAIPYNEGFESIAADGDLPVCMARSSIDACITYTGPQTFPTRTARTGTKFASYDTGFGNIPAGGAYFYSAPLQLTAGQSYKFSVWYITDGTSVWDVLEASFGTNQSPVGLTIIPGASVTLPTNTTYQELTGIFTAPTTGSYYVALRCVSNDFFANLDFDDISITPPPACIAPIGVVTSAITTSTATVNWSAVAGSTGYNIQYRLIGAPTFTAFAGNPVATTTANLTGLSASSTYEIQVQNRCSAILTSAFSNSVNFNTTCGTITSFPYEEGFEGISINDELPNCMAKSSAAICKTYTSAQVSFNRIPRTGNKFGAFRYGTATTGDYFYSAALQLTAGKTYKFSVWYTTDGSTSWGTLDAYVGNTQTPTGLVAIAGASVVAPSSLAYSELTGTFTVPSTGVYYVALRCATPSTLPDYLSLDDLSVSFPCANVVFAPATLPSGDLTTPYNQTIAATGGTAPYVYSVSAGVIPAGLTFNTATGVISGTPTATAITPPTFTIKVTDATGCSSFKNYSITITSVPCAAISLIPTSVPAGTLGTLYPATAVQFVATGVAGATYNYSVVSGTLPSGMLLNATTGRLTGTPTNRPASSSITIRARVTTGASAGCFGTITVNLVINCSPMTITASITDAVVNTIYSQQIIATGGGTTGTFTYAVTTGTLPAGFTLNPITGVLSGTGTTLSTPTSITITATRTNGCDISQTYTFGVVPVIAAPVQLNPIQISSSSFRARWEPVARAVKYRIYVATSNNFDGGSFAIGYVGLAVIQDTSILVQNLKPETKYYIQITAISSADEVSPYSNLKDATTLSAITSIDNALSSQVKVSPNPSKDKFLVDFGILNLGKTTARVYDAQGKQVFSCEINTANTSNQATIPLGNMANGIYLLEIISNKGRILKRLVKE